MAMAFWIIIGASLIWLLTSGFIYLGFYILQFMTIVPDSVVFEFEDALKFGEIIAMAFIMAGIVAIVLNGLGIIDIKCLWERKND